MANTNPQKNFVVVFWYNGTGLQKSIDILSTTKDGARKRFITSNPLQKNNIVSITEILKIYAGMGSDYE